MLGIYPSPRFPSAGLQKQWLRKPSPRCNLEWIYTCGTIETWYLGDPHSVRQNVSSLSGLSKKGGESVTVWGLFRLPLPSSWSGTCVTPRERTKQPQECLRDLGKPGQNSHCNFSLCPEFSSSAHLGSPVCVCVSFHLTEKLPSGFYCSFEEGDCGWMQGSSTPHPSPWWIGSPEHNRFPSIEGM